MRTRVRIDDELLLKLKEQEGTTLNRFLDRTLRAGMRAAPKPTLRRRRDRERERTHAMGQSRTDKALTLAAAPEDEEIVRKLLGRN